MLIIRGEQMETFRSAALVAFEAEMMAHCQAFSPPLCKTLGDERLLGFIRLGMDRASAYGFTNRGPIRSYLEMMLLFGSAFDTDPQYPWAQVILANETIPDQMFRAERLYEKTLDYLRQVNGPEDRYAVKALKDLKVMAQQALAFSSDNFVAGLIQEMTMVYPQKVAYVGDEPLKALIRAGIDQSKAKGLRTVRGVALLSILMFAFGHGCIDDPLYPWIGRTLDDETVTDPAARAQRLEKKAITWLDHVLAGLYGEKPH
jgi:hypothetical protein